VRQGKGASSSHREEDHRNQGPPVPSRVLPKGRTSPQRGRHPSLDLRQVGCDQLFYYSAASRASHSPYRVLGTFRLLYLCPIGLTECTGVLTETHLRNQATLPSSPTQEDAAKEGNAHQVYLTRSELSLGDFSLPFCLVKGLFKPQDTSHLQICDGKTRDPPPPCNQPPHGQRVGDAHDPEGTCPCLHSSNPKYAHTW